MIRVNLARRLKRPKAEGGGPKLPFAGLDFDFKELLGRLRGSGGMPSVAWNSPLPKIVVAVAMCWFIGNTLEEYEQDALKKIDAQIAGIEKETASIQAKVAKLKGFEPMKKQLEEDEQALRTKLQVVGKLMQDRGAPAKLMMQLAQSIPEEVWLTELKVSEESVKLNGATMGYQFVSDFIRALNSTSQFGEIALSGIQENTSAAKDVRYQMFELQAKRRQGD